ncbi:MAG: hypothetical protein Q8M95_11920 [Candidatus Methanoperedens sp.]|nr:hypothetical protein [Candidatus Methanoperedens sp.]
MKITMVLILFILLSALSGCLSLDKSQADILEPRENSEAGVKITVTYLPDITDATAFDIEVTSHMDYNDDFANISYLQDTVGKTYNPISYEGSKGHHASGILRFPKIEGKKFDLVIQDVAGVKERLFKW